MALVSRDDFRFQPGDVIVQAKPLIYCISKECVDFCAGCFKSQAESEDTSSFHLKECSNCHQFRYCSQKCQRSDWKKFHKLGECEIYAQHASKLVSNFARVALRLTLMQSKRANDVTRKFRLMDGNERSFADLEKHLNEIKSDEERVRSFVKTISLLQSLGVTCNTEDVFTSLAKLCINSFSILDTSLNEIGTGLYIETSVFDHSCAPNAAPVFNGLQIEIRAMKHVHSNEPVTINYVDIKEAKSSRVSKLQAHYYFTCQCERCRRDEIEGENTSICSEIASLDASYDNLVCSSSPGASSPPSPPAAGHVSNVPWNECYILLLKTLPLYEAIYGEYHPDFTVQLMRCFKVRSNIDFVDGSDSLTFLVSKLSRAIEVTHGKEHPLYNQFKDCFQL